MLVILQPRLSRFVAERRSRVVEHGGLELWIGIFLTGVYGGYFGAAQGVILLSLLGIFIADTLQRLNAVKNVLALIANGVAAVLFVFFADVTWTVVVLIAVGSVVGAQLGATVGRRLPAPALRGADRGGRARRRDQAVGDVSRSHRATDRHAPSPPASRSR